MIMCSRIYVTLHCLWYFVQFQLMMEPKIVFDQWQTLVAQTFMEPAAPLS
jgi:hypothetical protein